MVLRCSCVLLLALLASPPASADETAAAREIYQRGVRYFNLGQFEGALDAFSSIYTPDHPELLWNIAQCQRQLHQYEAARRSYLAFAAAVPDSPDAAAAARWAQEMEERAAAAASAPPSAPTATPAVAVRPSSSPLRDRRRPARATGIAMTGGGIAVVAAGAALAALTGQATNQAWHSGVYDYDADQRRSAYRSGAIAAFTVGGAVTIAGVALWAASARHR